MPQQKPFPRVLTRHLPRQLGCTCLCPSIHHKHDNEEMVPGHLRKTPTNCFLFFLVVFLQTVQFSVRYAKGCTERHRQSMGFQDDAEIQSGQYPHEIKNGLSQVPSRAFGPAGPDWEVGQSFLVRTQGEGAELKTSLNLT